MAEIINWQDQSNHLLINKKWPDNKKARYQRSYEDYLKKINVDSSVFIASSATGGEEKIYALKKEAFLNSARAVVEHIHMEEKTTSLCPLPLHHVGGLAIYARAYLLKQKVLLLEKWNLNEFYKLATHSHYISLVPTQVYDLVQEGIESPKSVKGIFVGGDALDPKLYEKAVNLKWPLLATYGATEVCSQIATAKLPFQKKIDMVLLPHMEAKTNENKELYLKSNSLFHSYYEINNAKVQWPELDNEGYYKTQDRVEMKGRKIKVLGRSQDWVKIMAELIHLKELEQHLALFLETTNIHLIALPDKRRGHILCIVSQEDKKIKEKLTKWNQERLGYERIDRFLILKEIPRNELGKIKKQEIKSDILLKKIVSYPV